jgi:hypothetical protein
MFPVVVFAQMLPRQTAQRLSSVAGRVADRPLERIVRCLFYSSGTDNLPIPDYIQAVPEQRRTFYLAKETL